MTPARNDTVGEWEFHKEEIKSLYLTQGMTREQVMTFMGERHNFHKTFVHSSISS
jgi:hypothetical protein